MFKYDDLEINRDKIMVCGDLVYHYQFSGDLRPRASYFNYYPNSQMDILNRYKRYLNECDLLMRDKKMELEKQGLPLCLGDVFVFTPEMYGVRPPSESSLNVSKRHLRDLIHTNFGINPQHSNYPLFLTLTYKNPQFSTFQVKQDLLLFIKRLRYHSKIKHRCISIPEKHQSSVTRADRLGSFHYHILLFDVPSEKTSNKHTLRAYQNELTDIWGKGFAFLKQCYGSPSSVAGYVTKYLEKDLSIEVGRRYLATRNCWKPEIFDDLSTLPPLEFKSSSTYTLLSGEFLKLSINKIHHIKN